MLPGPVSGAVSLADVLADCLAAVSGEWTRTGIPPVDRAAVIVCDGLGADNLRARSGHARNLIGAMSTKAAVIDTGVPTTTAAALASLTTGTRPGTHGIVGYTALEPASQRVLNQLHGFDDGSLAPDWQTQPTIFERAQRAGFGAAAIGLPKYATSGFTGAVLRGARYVSAKTIPQRLEALGEALADRSWRGIVYCYIAELDMAGHDAGSASDDWADALEEVDAAVAGLSRGLAGRVGAFLTADHGMHDVPEHARLVIPADSELWRGVAHLAGEHRMLHLHADDETDPVELAARWLAAEGERAWVATRQEAIDAGWFGEVAPAIAPRIGDVLVAARKTVAYYTEAAYAGHAGRMVGQHGSWTPTETRVPLLRFGAFV